MVGLALREKLMVPDAEAETDTDLYLKAPQFGGALKRAALPTVKWWRSRVDGASSILDEIHARGGADVLARLSEAMQSAGGDRYLRANGDVLCAYLSVRREDLFGSETVESWPTVTLYQDTKKLRRKVLKALTAYRDSLSAVAPAEKEVKAFEQKGNMELRRKNSPLGQENIPSGSPQKGKPYMKWKAKPPTVGLEDETYSKSRSLGSLNIIC
jgi:hypothetical protein